MDINKLVKETYEMMSNQKELDSRIKENRAKIQEYFDSNNMQDNTLEVDNIKVTKVQSAYITYKGTQLEMRLREIGKGNLIHKIIRKSYSIINIKAFTDLIKLTGISPKTLRTHLDIQRQVDGNTIKSLFERGELSTEDLDGCFESKLVNSVRFTEIKQPEGD